MPKTKPTFVLISILTLLLLPFVVQSTTTSEQSTHQANLQEVSASTQSELKLDLFYSKSCPHCGAEKDFIKDTIKPKYDNLTIKLHSLGSQGCFERLKCFYEKYGVPKERWGLVPTTFIGEDYFVGFDSAQNLGRQMIESIEKQIQAPPVNYNNPQTSKPCDEPCDKNKPAATPSPITVSTTTPSTSTTPASQKSDPENDQTVSLPLIGSLNTAKHSLPALTILMGTLDGFNVCSLGALVLILGLVIALRSRRQILSFGGVYILTTAIIYGFLIVLWYKLFTFLAPYIRYMELFIALLALGGAAYFLKEFYRMKKHGATCEGGLSEGFTGKLTKKVKGKIKKADKTNIAAVAGSILIFAAVITIVEFPCSAAVPVIYASILADANIAGLNYLLYIAFFVVFYMLDELIVFGIAVWKMTVWMESPKFVTWATFVEALVLAGLGFWYLIGV